MENVETENFWEEKGSGRLERWKLGERLLSSRESLDPQVDSTSRVVSRFDSAPLQHLQPGGRVFFHQGATR